MKLLQVLDATGAEAGAFSLVDHDRGELVVQAHTGYPLAAPHYGEHHAAPSKKWEQGLIGESRVPAGRC